MSFDYTGYIYFYFIKIITFRNFKLVLIIFLCCMVKLILRYKLYSINFISIRINLLFQFTLKQQINEVKVCVLMLIQFINFANSGIKILPVMR